MEGNAGTVGDVGDAGDVGDTGSNAGGSNGRPAPAPDIERAAGILAGSVETPDRDELGPQVEGLRDIVRQLLGDVADLREDLADLRQLLGADRERPAAVETGAPPDGQQAAGEIPDPNDADAQPDPDAAG